MPELTSIAGNAQGWCVSKAQGYLDMEVVSDIVIMMMIVTRMMCIPPKRHLAIAEAMNGHICLLDRTVTENDRQTVIAREGKMVACSDRQ